jgi:hypothetical protein
MPIVPRVNPNSFSRGTFSRSAFSRSTFTRNILLCAAAGLFFSEVSAESIDSQSKPTTFFALPMEVDADYGATNGDATITRIMPLYGYLSTDNWKIMHLDMLTIANAPGGVPGRPGNPNPEPGGTVFGLGDLLHASFYTPMNSSSNLTWGMGGMLSIPTASEDSLGSGKWSGGPSFRFVYKSESWSIGAVGGQIWSFAGDDDRGDVSQLFMRGAFRWQLPDRWYFVSSPVVTANWNASGEKWLVPVGGGFGKVFNLNSDPWAISLQGYYNVIKPDGAPDWAVRLSVTAAIRLGN